AALEVDQPFVRFGAGLDIKGVRRPVVGARVGIARYVDDGELQVAGRVSAALRGSRQRRPLGQAPGSGEDGPDDNRNTPNGSAHTEDPPAQSLNAPRPLFLRFTSA